MIEPGRRFVSVEEYLELEKHADYKSEYFDGEVFAMAGGTPEHNLIAANLIRELGNQLEERPCRVYPSDQRVKIPDTGLYTYPDLSVVCEEPQFEEPGRCALLNPTLIVEVLSETTEAYDRGDKFAHYRRVASLREYVLVASNRRRIERFTRQDGGSEWVLAECSDATGSLPLPSIQCVLSLPRVYSKVEFPEREPGRRRGPE
jgi:Uma2 family endonuclease